MASNTIELPIHTIRGRALRDAGLEFCWMTLSGEYAVPTANKFWPLSIFQFDHSQPCANEKIPAEPL